MKSNAPKFYVVMLSILWGLSPVSTCTASIITYDSLSTLSNNTSNLVIEDWQQYPTNTILSNTSLNGIIYPNENASGEPLTTGCRYGNLWCISYQTQSGKTRDFGPSAVKFSFEHSIDSFSLSLVQGTNNTGAGESEWDIEFDTGEVFSMRSVYGESDSLGLSYIGITGINSTEFTVRQTRNDSNVVWSFNHIGYQVASQVPEPSTLVIFALGMMGLAARRFKK